MEMTSTTTGAVSLRIEESSQVGEARRLAGAMTRERNFPDAERSTANLLATEAANNLVKHAGGGELIFHFIEEAGGIAFEIIAIDRGPGMADVDRCLTDGFSTAGSPGTGLGAMARLSSFFDIYSRPQNGTLIQMRLWGRPPSNLRERRFVVGGISTPAPGEETCGDAWVAAENSAGLTLMVSDGLGHGPLASEASHEAVLAFRENADQAPADVIESAHGALRATRGAAVAVTRIDLDSGAAHFAGIGNIAAVILSGDATRNMVSHNGIVGHQMRKVREMTYPWSENDFLIMNSDGIQTRWNLNQFPGLAQHHPTLIAAAIYREFKRPRDDVTVALARLSL